MRNVTWGTPKRSEHYLNPRPAFAFVMPALLGGLALLLVMTLAYCVGFRRTLSPGPLISAHATFETSCQGCHAPSEGASNARCQRCHDPSGAGRLDNRAHVLFGSNDPKKAAAAPILRCAQCHIEHRGGSANLKAVAPLQCTACHFRSFAGHPEFALLRSPVRELPGIRFGHGPVSKDANFKGHVNELMTKKRLSLAQACIVCHEPKDKDFQPISFARHCAECHNKAMQPTVGIPEDDVASSAWLASQGIAVNETEFERARGKVAKTTVRHKDEWILASVRRLHAQLDPQAAASERAALTAQLSRLRRRLVLAQPLATLDVDALRARQKAIAQEIKGLEQRIKAQAGASPGVFDRVDEGLGALFAATTDAALRTDAAAIRRDADALRGKPAADAPARDFNGDRKQVLALLDSIEAADPSQKPRVEDLRRRLLALSAGESTLDVLARAQEQRLIERARIEDELRLRAQGPLPAASAVLLGAGRALETTIADLEAQLAQMDAVPPAPAGLTEEMKARKKESLDALVASCVKCHVVSQFALARVRAAQPVLVRGRFIHQPHLLQADCVRCHPGLEKSPSAQDLNFRGVTSCQECHRPRAVRQDCLTCHSYHAPSLS